MRALATALVATFCLQAGFPSGAQAEDRYAIEPVAGGVYRFSAGPYHSVFAVGSEGIFVADPIDRDAAAYLKNELARRFDVPIRYLAYSHNHPDHVLGGDVLDGDAVTVIAHEAAAADIERTRLPTARPELTFEQALTVDLGDRRIELRYHGPNNGRGSISMRFLPERVLHVVDWIVIGRMPYKDLPGYDIEGMIRSTRAVLDGPGFDRFVGGHGEMGDRRDVERYLAYLEALYEAVLEGMLAGQPLSTLKETIRLSEYEDLRMYEQWLPLNVAGVHRTLEDMSYISLRPDIDSSEAAP
jgi:glyoxylase-like metal-dependent hydrolase (beta-lactamase superfamily II)